MERLKKTAKILDTLAKILFIFCISMLIVLAAGAIFLSLMPENFATSIFPTLLIHGIRLNMNQPSLTFTRAEFIVLFISAAVTAAIQLIILAAGAKKVRKILAPMRLGIPFNPGISNMLIRFGHFVLIASVIGGFLQGITSNITVYLLLKSLSEIGTPNNSYFLFDADGIIIAVIIYLVGFIFRYGEELQKQADETL